LILILHADIPLLMILLCSIYTVWPWAMLRTFRKKPLPPTNAGNNLHLRFANVDFYHTV